MFLPQKESKNYCKILGLAGLPEHYPSPCDDDMLFFIQRNQNTNTVIYKLNLNSSEQLDLNNPVEVYWRLYDSNREKTPLNAIQRELAYGIDYDIINKDTIEMNVVSYPSFKIYISKNDEGEYEPIAKINDMWSTLSNVYVYAEDNGAFPMVKYVELYGVCKSTNLPCYEKFSI